MKYWQRRVLLVCGKHIDSGIDLIDKRKRKSLVEVISKARRCKPEELLTYLSEVEVKVVCSAMGVDTKG